MEFAEFASKLKPIIGGAESTSAFAKTLLEIVVSSEGRPLLEDVKESTYKSYFNGYTKITKMAQRISPYLEPEEMVDYLNGFSDETAQQIVDTFIEEIPDLDNFNMAEKMTDYFCSMVRAAATTEKKKGTPKSAKKNENTPNDILIDKILASGQAVADAWGNIMENLASETDNSNPSPKRKGLKLNEDILNAKDMAYLERFKKGAEPLLEYCIEHDPTAEGTKITLADEINDFLRSWKFDVRKIKDPTFRSIVLDTMQVLDDYTYYLSDKFLRLIPDTDVLWFRNESWEEGEQLREVLRPETIKKRYEMRDIYLRLYPIPEDDELHENSDMVDAEVMDDCKPSGATNENANTTIIQNQVNVVQNGTNNANITNTGTLNFNFGGGKNEQ